MYKSFRIYCVLALFTFAMFFIQSCKNNTQIVGSSGGTSRQILKKSTINGQVVTESSGIPLDSALIFISGSSISQVTYTNSQGKYTFQVELGNTTTFSITTSKSNYVNDTTNITVTYGNDYNAPLIRLTQINTGTTPSGNPTSIYLISQSASSIGIKESGSIETARLTFEVQDSVGNPIDVDHSVDVYFYLGSAPEGGESIEPTVIRTNTLGKASVNLTSGTKAGAVQIIAKINFGGKTIISKPVSISIHGGLPDLNHFSLSAESINFPGYDIYGLTDKITAYVGDKYGNPVKPQTAVYFTTTGGIIEGSALTDNLGTGTVNLLSAAPKPDDSVFGPGFARITASTANENLNTILTQSIILFSGTPRIIVIPSTFDIPNGGSQKFNYTVSDENGNPLAKGTSITVTVDGTSVGSQGNLSVTLPDTQNRAWTKFNFMVFDNVDTVNVASPVSISILTTGPNGSAIKTFSGISR